MNRNDNYCYMNTTIFFDILCDGCRPSGRVPNGRKYWQPSCRVVCREFKRERERAACVTVRAVKIQWRRRARVRWRVRAGRKRTRVRTVWECMRTSTRPSSTTKARSSTSRASSTCCRRPRRTELLCHRPLYEVPWPARQLAWHAVMSSTVFMQMTDYSSGGWWLQLKDQTSFLEEKKLCF